MKQSVPRLRVFLGPNGSGKSTIARRVLERYPSVFVNADIIEASLHEGSFTFGDYDLSPRIDSFEGFLERSSQYRLSEVIDTRLVDGHLLITGQPDSYLAASIAEFIRASLILGYRGFAFESVFSHDSKLEILRVANRLGYRIYLYVVCTEDPEINVGRVLDRVSRGGHAVDAEKVVARYDRFLSLLPSAVDLCDRAYFFDNSAEDSDSAFFAEYDGDSASIDWKEEWVPGWFVSSFPQLFPANSSND